MKPAATLLAWEPVLRAVEKYDVTPVAEPYWPRSFRDLCALWLTTAMDSGTFDAVADQLPKSRLQEVVDRLSQSTAHRISAADRRFILWALKVYCSRAEKPPPKRLPREASSSADEWPFLNAVADLSTDVGTLRLGISNYLIKHFERFDLVMVTFNDEEMPPISIHVAEEHAAAAKEELRRLERESDADFSPRAVARIVGTSAKLAIHPEQAATCGTGLSKQDSGTFGGSIACFVKTPAQESSDNAGETIFAITAAHVLASPKQGVELVQKCKTADSDIALVTVDPAVFGYPLCNNLALSVVHGRPQLKRGDTTVYKIGAATGLTMGCVVDWGVAARGVSGQLYQNATLVLPKSVTEQISAGGDSGALWVYEQNGIFYPLGIHVTTGEYFDPNLGRHRPCAIAQPFDIDYLISGEWKFVGPPHGATEPHVIEQLDALSVEFERAHQPDD